jgi:hypothetical protein
VSANRCVVFCEDTASFRIVALGSSCLMVLPDLIGDVPLPLSSSGRLAYPETSFSVSPDQSGIRHQLARCTPPGQSAPHNRGRRRSAIDILGYFQPIQLAA